MLNPWIVLALVATIAGAGWVGYSKGVEITELRYEAELSNERQKAIEAGFESAKIEAARLALVEANRMLSRQFEDKAYAEPPVVASCLPDTRRMRLQARIDAANRAAAGKP